MFVLTIDQRDSRTHEDRVPSLLSSLEGTPVAAEFQRTAGDEVQGLLTEPSAVRSALLIALRQGWWHCGIGVGAIEPGSFDTGVRAGRGPGYLAAREAVDAAKNLTGSVAVRAGGDDDPATAPTAAGWAEDCEAVWQLVAALVLGRTEAQWRVVDAVDATDTQVQAATELGMRPTSVAGALRLSRIREERAVYGALDRLLAGAHAALGADGRSAAGAGAHTVPEGDSWT